MEINAIIEKIKAYLLSPSKAFDGEKKTDMVEALKYLLLVGIVLAVLSAVISYVTAGALLEPLIFVSALVGGYIGLVIGSFVGAIILHMFAYIFGARKGFTQTYKIIVYSSTPTLVLGWIPFVNIITGLWGLFLTFTGLKKLQEMPSTRAGLTILVPLVIGLIIATIWVLTMFSAITTFMGMSGMSGGIMDLPF